MVHCPSSQDGMGGGTEGGLGGGGGGLTALNSKCFFGSNEKKKLPAWEGRVSFQNNIVHKFIGYGSLL